ncbi:TlpA family protein disulfide reductase [Sphingobacterium spiritivorum]|uniref:TlpA family protein disulfide reductase n=1 Tax=Sphingobacterium spiritivorum TaxID=258 RepID=UPI003DA5FFE7
MKKFIYIILLLISMITIVFAKSKDSIDYPVIGKPIPQFTLQNVKYFNKTTVTNEDLKGKWFMLDFWGEYCASCIASFPKMNEIQRQFANEFQLILIGVPHKERLVSIEQVYEKHRQHHDLNMAITFDGKLADQFHLYAYPHQVIVDPQGIVRYITSGVSKDDVRQIINGKKPALRRVYNAVEPKPQDQFDRKIPLLMNGNGGDEEDYYIRSVFTKASDKMPLGFTYFMDDNCQILRCGLEKFYKYAFKRTVVGGVVPQDSLYGKFWPEIILEVKDSTLFTVDQNTFENTFAYSAFTSEKYRRDFGPQKIDFARLLKEELEVLLPYKASLENRSMPCYEMYISNSALKKIKSKKTDLEFKWLGGYGIGFEAKGMTILNFRSKLINSPNYNKSIPLLYNGPDILIDMTLKSLSFEDRVKELKEMGIEIKKVQRQMDVIVIRDK